MSCKIMLSLGVYVLGAADAGERARVETHLPGCPACQAELARLAPLPGLLAGVPGEMRAAGALPGEGDGLPRPAIAGGQPTPARTGGQPRPLPAGGQPRPARTRGRPGRRWAAVAACGAVAACVAAAAGVAGGFWLAPAGPAARQATVTLSGANPATHMSATAALTATSWGTSIRLRLRGLPLNVPCRLIVRSRTGATEVAGVWDAWRDGPISVPASAGWQPAGIASLEVATPAKTLVTIAVRHQTAPASAAPEQNRAP
jgi:hypothetical protein